MLSTNQRPTQELTWPIFNEDNDFEGVENFPRGIRATGEFGVLRANSRPEVRAGLPTDWKDLAVYRGNRLSSRRRNADISLQAHIRSARVAIAELLEREQGAEQDKTHQEALAWLATNRERYAGQWIALRGAELLATGANARDVYERVRERKPSALILKIEPEDLPFAGW